MTYKPEDLLYHDHEHGPECRDEDGDVASWTCPFMLANPMQSLGEDEFAETRGKARLTHSCGEWVIGGPDEVRALIRDLQALLTRMDPSSQDGHDAAELSAFRDAALRGVLAHYHDGDDTVCVDGRCSGAI